MRPRASRFQGLAGIQPSRRNDYQNMAYRIATLLPQDRMCYKRRAVESIPKTALQSVSPKSALPGNLEAAVRVADATAVRMITSPVAQTEDASRYCPVCSQRLTARHCKLLCTTCGYYMSCADYY